jgi:hypothetical protein
MTFRDRYVIFFGRKRTAEVRVDQDKNSEPPSEGGTGGNLLERTARAFQQNVVRSAPVAAASYTLIGAIVLLGGVGFLLDRWLGTLPVFLIGGLLLGIAVGFYELVRAVRRP